MKIVKHELHESQLYLIISDGKKEVSYSARHAVYEAVAKATSFQELDRLLGI